MTAYFFAGFRAGFFAVAGRGAAGFFAADGFFPVADFFAVAGFFAGAGVSTAADVFTVELAATPSPASVTAACRASWPYTSGQVSTPPPARGQAVK